MTSLPLFDDTDDADGDGHTAVLTCGHRVSVPAPEQLPVRADLWYAARLCPACHRQREIVSVLNPKETTQ